MLLPCKSVHSQTLKWHQNNLELNVFQHYSCVTHTHYSPLPQNKGKKKKKQTTHIPINEQNVPLLPSQIQSTLLNIVLHDMEQL